MVIKIGIIGIGFVGNTIKKSFQIHKLEVKTYDKYKNTTNSFKECLNTEILFLCLPTLFNKTIKEYDKKSINNTIELLNNSNYKGLIVIKSTIEPETTMKLGNKYPNLNICHNPEFLSKKTAFKDFHNQKHIVIGKNNNSDINYLLNLYKKYYSNAQISICSSVESESMKIMCNSFYASKIMLFNEYYKLCESNGTNFNKIRDLMLKNKWINPMHTLVPGSDGKLAYGGSCLDKDTKALNQYMIKNSIKNNILEKIIDKCSEYRN